jgi:lipoprotein-anchoring transpeptidase ErfK/SrfK
LLRLTRMKTFSIFLASLFMSFVLSGSAVSAASQQPVTTTPGRDAQMQRVLAMQVALDRAGFSPGEIDGKSGGNTDRALRAFQLSHKLAATGELDTPTTTALGEPFTNPVVTYSVTAEDTAGPFTESIPVDMMKKADLPALSYTSVREMLAERFHVSPALLAKLNPKATFAAGETINVPNVQRFDPPAASEARGDVARAGGAVAKADGARATPADAVKTADQPRKDLVITVEDAKKTLTVTDASGQTLFHAPVTVGSSHDPLPVGEWKVNGVDRRPAFNYNPDLFWDANPSHSKAKLAPGPNNPVGVVWIDLSKEHYGIHGTPEPSRIGHTESHGCIRLTNWDAARLATLVGPGTKVVLK